MMCFIKNYFLWLCVFTALTHAQPDFSMTGFATMNGGTTGGQSGEVVTAQTFQQLKGYAESSLPYVIMIEGRIHNGSGGGQIRVASHKSLIGVGNNAFLDGIGIEIRNSNNIIIRNLKMTLTSVTPNSEGIVTLNGGDVISIRGSSKNIWIDHCEIYSENPDVQKNIDKYDGLLDIRDQTGFITISWNHFHNHHKCTIVGASDTDLYSDRKVTFHHNYYDNIKLRIPMYRGATGHFFNNYVSGAKDATEIRIGTCLRVESNYYEKLNYSIYTPTDARGSAQRINNIEVSRASRAYPANCVASIPYNYSSMLISAADVKTIIPMYAGVGKINSLPALTEVFRGNGQMFDSLMVFDVTNAENWNIRNGLKQGDVVFGDRNFSLAEIPQDLQGSEWIQTSMNSRTNISLDHYASFRAKTNGVLYVAHADRVSVKPAWLNSYTRTNHNIVVQENVSTLRTLTLYEKPFATGDKIFTENNSADGTASSLMYLMIFSDRSIGEPQDEPTVSEIHLQPTPLSLQIKKQSNTTLHIAYSLPMNTKAKLSIYQENGTQIHQQSLLGNAGNHNVKINTPVLTPGIYYVHLNTASKTLQKQIVILHP
jgi:pectate lyase